MFDIKVVHVAAPRLLLSKLYAEVDMELSSHGKIWIFIQVRIRDVPDMKYPA